MVRTGRRENNGHIEERGEVIEREEWRHGDRERTRNKNSLNEWWNE